MAGDDRVNILLVDDQPAKLMSYEVILRDLGESLITASSGREALEQLLKKDIAVILVDVCMPDLDGFELASMIRDHPRFQKTAMIFVSAIHLTDMDRLRGYEIGAVDYVPVPVVPEVLRAKVKIFAELYRKTRQLERLNLELEARVTARTAELEASTARLIESERRRGLALAAGKMGSWDWDRLTGHCLWDEGQHRIFGVDPESFEVTQESVAALIYPEDWPRLRDVVERLLTSGDSYQAEFRVRRPDGETRWCLGSAAASVDGAKRIVRISGVTTDITERKKTEEHQMLLAREVDHRAKNALAVVQSIVRLTRAKTIDAYIVAIEGRINALARAHTVLSESRWEGADLGGLVDEELAPYRSPEQGRVFGQGPQIWLQPSGAQTLALALHELATNAAKYGALSTVSGRVDLTWDVEPDGLVLRWAELGGPPVRRTVAPGFGLKIIIGSIEQQLGGLARFDWRPIGLHCTLTVPRNDKLTFSERHPARADVTGKSPAASKPRRVPEGGRIMVVEDESLVAMALCDMLAELGYSVVGPFAQVNQALVGATEQVVDGAILDLNLCGELVYPVAELLASGGIPFVFVTGHAIESVDPRFSSSPILQKPIEVDALRCLFDGVTLDQTSLRDGYDYGPLRLLKSAAR